MSESVTTSAPAAPAPAAPAPVNSDSGPVISGPPSQQQPLSVSEAARLLNKHRREGAAAAPAAPAAARPAAPVQGEQGAQPKPSAAEAMAKALGVPVEAQQGAAPPPESAPIGGEIEIDGRRYSTEQLRTLVGQGSDYTKKTQALAEQTRSFQEQQRQLQSQAQALAQVLPYIQPEIQRLQQALQEVPQPDAALIDSNPQEYLRQQQRWQAAMQEQQRIGQLSALQSEAQARAMQQQVDAANESLAQEFPAWRDPKERASWQQEIVDWALDRGGYNRDELRGLTDARHLKLMMKAMQFDRWVQGVATKAPPVINGALVRGTPPPPAPTAQVQQAEAAFDKRPSVRSGAALLAARRSGGGNGLAR